MKLGDFRSSVNSGPDKKDVQSHCSIFSNFVPRKSKLFDTRLWLAFQFAFGKHSGCVYSPVHVRLCIVDITVK